MDPGAKEHAAEGRVVDPGASQRQAPEARPPHLDLDHDLPVEPVAAGGPARLNLELEVGLVLGHPPDPLAALDRDLAGDRKVIDVLAGAVEASEESGEQR